MAEIDGRRYRVASIVSSTSFTVTNEAGTAPLDSSDFSLFYDPDGDAAVYPEVVQLSNLLASIGDGPVSVVGDGGVLGDLLVIEGVLDLPSPASIVVVGYPYNSLLETTRVTGGNPRGSDQGRPISIPRITFRFFETATAAVGRGPSPNKYETVVFRIGQDPLDKPPPIFSGDKRISVSGSWDDHPTILVKAVDPLPLTVLSMTIEAIAGIDA
jgi:hypothetical protein